ncbi:fanconi-associated nuclease 1-like [Diachasmimorpha longicaudata]|uniref:fanconi-associated nuclease 1-like n=1 Tax=Diachasmimorpha longicaudata TaxID=58733 RepID=UPI0030B8A884
MLPLNYSTQKWKNIISSTIVKIVFGKIFKLNYSTQQRAHNSPMKCELLWVRSSPYVMSSQPIIRTLTAITRQTKASGSSDGKSKIEVTPKQRRTLSVASKKVLGKPSKSSRLSQISPMKSNRPKDLIILDDSSEDSPPTGPPTIAQGTSSSSNFSKSLKNLQKRSKTPKSHRKVPSSSRPSTTPQLSPSQTPKYCISLLDSDDDAETPLPTPHQCLEKNSKKKFSPKRALSFTSCSSPLKRQRINDIMCQQLTKENSFQGYALTTTTSLIESIGPSQVLTQEIAKEMSFSTKTESVIKEDVMLSEDDWNPAEAEDSMRPLMAATAPGKSPKSYLRILSSETINRRFDSHRNSQKNSQETGDQGPKKADKTLHKILESEKNMRIDGSRDFEAGVSVSPETPTKGRNSAALRTPERSSKLKLSLQKNRVSESPLNKLETPPARTPSTFSPTKMSPTKRHYYPRKIFKESINLGTVVENLNLARQGVIPMNDFDLGEIYETGEFKFQWGTMDTSAAEQYDISDVVVPMSKHSERLLEMISWVFAEPANCAYFDEEERDMIFRILTLKQEEQVLLAIMLKREIRWFRVNKQNYEKHIEGNMESSLMSLAQKGFFNSDWESVDIEIIFSLLQVDELKEVCRLMKLNHNVAKPKMIASLKQLLRQKRSHFSTKSPCEVLKSRLLSVVGPILKLADSFVSLIHRILVLYYPNHIPEDKLSDIFFLFSEVHYGNKTFPSTPITRYPLFKNRQSLIDYVEAKLMWSEIARIMSEKNKGPSHWEAARELGTKAYDRLKELVDAGVVLQSYQQHSSFKSEKQSYKLPSHIGRFTSIYVWSKIMILSIEAFKKIKPDGYIIAATYLEFLLNNRGNIPVSSGKLYKELTMIKMSHLKNPEHSARLTLEAFSTTSSIIDQAEMLDRAKKLAGRVNGISVVTKDKLKNIVAEKETELLCLPREREIEVMKVEREGMWGKSLWLLRMEDEETGYGSVEDVALNHYADIGYPKGIHCEGALPVTLFACLFWKEIYELPVPGAFVSPFQNAPLDLFGSNFYENRREHLEKKFAELEALKDFECVWVNMVENYRDFMALESIIREVVADVQLFYEIIKCLGKNGVLGICKRIVLEGFVNWRSGFPDLFVWNAKTEKCKVVEVKGPGDTLSVKQKLWIKYLEEIGVKVEVCLVKAMQQC